MGTGRRVASHASTLPSTPPYPLTSSDPTKAPDFNELIAPVDLPRRRIPAAAIWGGGLLAALVIALVAMLLILRPFSGANAADYSQALDRTSALHEDYTAASNAIDDAYSFMYSISGQADAASNDDLGKAADALESDIDAFKELRVVQRNETVAAAFDLYKRQGRYFAQMAHDLADSAQPLSDVFAACNTVPSLNVNDTASVDDFALYITNCRAAADTLSRAASQTVADHGATVVATMDQMNTLVAQVREVSASTTLRRSERASQLESLSDQIIDLTDPYEQVSTLQDSLDQARVNADPTELLQRLDDALRQSGGAAK